MSSDSKNSSTCSENDLFEPIVSPTEKQKIFNEVKVEETESWPGNFRNNVRCLEKGDDNQTLKGRLGYFFLNEDLADVHFIVRDEEEDLDVKVPAHKFVLAAGSCVFKAMFYGSLSSPGHNEIYIPDIDHTALRNLLKYLYVDEAEINSNNLVPTLYAAKKYQVTNLEKVCVNFLSWSLSPSENVLLVLSQAILFDEKQLVDLCWSKIEGNINEVIDSNNFESAEHSSLILLLKRHGLAVKEIDLFRAIVRWAKAECKRQELEATAENIRNVLGELLYLIRFPTMSGKEFMEVYNLGILTDEEATSVFSYFAYTQQEPISSQEKLIFSIKPRSYNILSNHYRPTKEIVLSRFGKSASGRFCMFDEVHKVDFIVNHPIHITGLGVYGTRCQKGERIVYIELRHSETSEILANGHSKITCTGQPKIYQVRFRMPPQILPHTIYTASAEFDGNYPYPTYYGINGRRICTVDVSTDNNESEEGDDDWGFSRAEERKKIKQIKFIFFKSEKNNFLDTGGEQGQIPQIMFYA